MDSLDLEKIYMDGYNKLGRPYAESGMQSVVEAMNRTIREADSIKAQDCLMEIQRRNQKVMALEDTRLSPNMSFKHLRLPAVSMFTILYDDIIRQWRFNTEPGRLYMTSI